MPYTLQNLFDAAGLSEQHEIARSIVLSKTPRKYQTEAVTQALMNVRFGLYDQPGVGKTLPAQAVALYYLLWGNRCLVIMPPALLKQFQRSLGEVFSGVYDHFSLHILDQSPARRESLFSEWNNTEWPHLLCMSYQMFVNKPRETKTSEVKSGATKPSVKKKSAPRLFTKLAKHYDVVICDEAHALCKPGSWASRGVNKVCGAEGSSALLLMTGTPMPNTPGDAYGLIKLVTPGVYKNRKQFDNIHCEYADNDNGYRTIIGYKDMEFLTGNLYRQARRVLKADVLPLDKPNIVEVEVELYPEHMLLYKKLVRERFLEVDGEIIDAVQAQSLRQKCLKIVANPDLFTESKVRNAVAEMLDELLDSVGARKQEKVVVFTNFRATTEMLKKHLESYNPCVVYGGAGNNRAEIDRYLSDPTARIMIANPQSGGVGIDGMQDVGSTAIFVEPTSVPGRFEQAMDRLHRAGQRNVVNVYIFKTLKTISPTLTQAMLGKGAAIKGALKDRQTVFDELMGY